MRLTDRQYALRELRRVRRVRRFPENTCPASRHVELIGENLAKRKPYPMLEEEPEHVAGSLLSTVASLYAARTEIDRLRLKLGLPYAADEELAKEGLRSVFKRKAGKAKTRPRA